MPELDILMAAYNGGRFIAEQIDSILNQTFQDFRLIIRDDGSSDNTPAIIEDYAEKYPGIIEIVHDDVVCKNPAKNFMELLKHAKADYVMFCDQDDYWLPYKVQVTLWHMKELERKNPGVPVLVFSGMKIVDADLSSLGKLMCIDIPERRYTFRELLPCNCAAGCTQMMNRPAYQGLGPYDDGIMIHDWWSILYASAFGVIEHIPSVLMLYRQHENNSIGASIGKYKRLSGVQKFLHNLASRPVEEFFEARERYRAEKRHIELFVSRYYDRLSPEKQKQLDDHMQLFGKSRIRRFIAVWNLDYLFNKGAFRKMVMAIKSFMF